MMMTMMSLSSSRVRAPVAAARHAQYLTPRGTTTAKVTQLHSEICITSQQRPLPLTTARSISTTELNRRADAMSVRVRR